jgi:hypothetical protein
MPVTPKLGIPYPVLADPADVPADTGELATQVDNVAGVAGGLATLDGTGKVPAAQLPPNPASIPPGIVDAKGDLIGASAADTPARVPAPTADGQTLVARSAQASGLAWEAPPGGIPGTIIDAKGDLIAGLAADTPGRVAPGVDGQILTVDSTQAAGVKWGAPPAGSGIPYSLFDALGDLLVGVADDVGIRMPRGADGEVLTVDSAAGVGLKWGPPPSGLPPTTGHEGDWLKVVAGAPAWVTATFVALAAYAAKGELLVASGPSAPVAIPVGANGQVLTADSAQASGVKWAAAAGGAPLVTALPGSPTDGQEVILVDSLTAPTYQWHLKYVAAKASNRWIFVGGAPALVIVAANEGTTNAAYSALATAGPSFVIGVAGDYEIAVGSKVQRTLGSQGTSEGYQGYDVGVTGAVDAAAGVGATGVNNASSVMQVSILRGVAANTALVAKYRSTNTNTSSFRDRWMRVTPIALGG